MISLKQNGLLKMNRNKNRWKFILLTIFIISTTLLIIPTVIAGELIYSASRNMNYEDLEGMDSIFLETEDQVSVQVWYKKSDASKAVLLVHGHFDHSALIFNRYASIFRDLEFDIVTLDLRNHGRSDHAPPVSMGIEERLDVEKTLKWMQEKWEDIVLFGTSMGSIAALLAQYETGIASRLILDSSFHDPIDTMKRNFEKNYVIQPYRYLIIQYLINIRSSGSLAEFPDILTILDDLNTPTLVAHGSADKEASPTFLLEVEELKNELIKTVMVEGAEHSRLHTSQQFLDAVHFFLEGSK